MKAKIRNLIDLPKSDYQQWTMLSSGFSIATGVAFTVYNAVLGILYGTPWNLSIGIYYFLLTVIRSIIVLSQKNPAHRSLLEGSAYRNKICRFTHILLLFMNVAMIAPIAIMVKGGRSYTFGLIPAIATAAYTTYRITMSILNYKKTRKSANVLVAELRTINLVDSCIAVLSLQNTLIAATGSMADMISLTAWTSAGILLLIIIIILQSFRSINWS